MPLLGGGTRLRDVAGRAYHGALQADTLLTAGNGWNTPVLHLDGTGDFIDCGTTLQPSSSGWSYAAWVYPTDVAGFTTGQDQVMGCGYNGTGTGLAMGWDFGSLGHTGNFGIIYYAGGLTVIGAFTSKVWGIGDINQWWHLAGTWDGATYRCFVNSIEDTVAYGTAANPYVSSVKYCIGAQDQNGTRAQYFTGDLDDVRVYRRCLEPGTIRQLADKTQRLDLIRRNSKLYWFQSVPDLFWTLDDGISLLDYIVLTAQYTTQEATGLVEYSDLVVAVTVPDASAVSDATNLAVQHTLADPGSVGDGADLAASSAVVDLTAVTDDTVLAVQLSPTDTLTALDSSDLAASNVLTDSIALVDSASVSALFGIIDSSVVGESADLSALHLASDVTNVTDSLEQQVALMLGDVIGSSDGSSLAVSIQEVQTISAVESSSLTALLSLFDTGTLTDIPTLYVAFAVSDSISGTDRTPGILFTLTDQMTLNMSIEIISQTAGTLTATQLPPNYHYSWTPRTGRTWAKRPRSHRTFED